MPALVLDGHPNPKSLTAALARRYADVHPDATLVALRDLDFDLTLHQGLRGNQAHEPDLIRTAELMVQADHLVLATPVWWYSTPALVKGFFDRILESGWAYTFRHGLPVGLLAGRTARVLLTADSPDWYLRLVKHDAPVHQLRAGTLRYVGYKPVSFTRFLNVRGADAARRQRWLEKVDRLATSDSQRRLRRTPSNPGALTVKQRTTKANA